MPSRFFTRSSKQLPGVDLGELGEFPLAGKCRRVPVVSSRTETQRLFSALTGTWRLMAQLLDGTGMRLMELPRLRVRDADFERHEIIVPGGVDFPFRPHFFIYH